MTEARVPGRTLRRRKLGAELRRHREAAGLTVTAVARYADLQPGTVSKIERGQQAIRPGNVRLMLQVCGVGVPTMDTLIRLAEESDERGWWTAYSDTLADWFATYVDLESDAKEIRTYATELVDGLLQIPEYAEAIHRAARPDLTDVQLRRLVELRQGRQSILDRKPAVHLHVVMSEAAIRQAVGGAAVMSDQIRHLATMAERPNITIQIMPFSAGAHPGMRGPFTLLGFPEGFDDMDCVYLENENGGLWQERPSDIARYIEVFAQLRTTALSPAETITLLYSLA